MNCYQLNSPELNRKTLVQDIGRYGEIVKGINQPTMTIPIVATIFNKCKCEYIDVTDLYTDGTNLSWGIPMEDTLIDVGFMEGDGVKCSYNDVYEYLDNCLKETYKHTKTKNMFSIKTIPYK